MLVEVFGCAHRYHIERTTDSSEMLSHFIMVVVMVVCHRSVSIAWLQCMKKNRLAP